MLLSDKYPFLTNYFETAIHSKTTNKFQSLVFSGTDLASQYELALELARLLNCSGDKSDSCQCLNCKWIREGSHPAVLTISRLDNKPEDDNSKTVISVKQAELIRNSLLTSSDFHRVFIFCDKDDEGNIKGLNRFNFQDSTANSLLKSIEEPPEKVTFIFLTREKEDLISTIISRSLCFPVPNLKREDYEYGLVQPVFDNYWTVNRENAFDMSENLVSLMTNNNPIKVLEQLQNYMLYILKSNPDFKFLINDIKSTEIAKKSISIGMKPDIVADDLCLKLIK